MKNRNTKSYLKLREQIQESFDFVYVVSQAVPCLKLQSSLIKKGVVKDLPNPDYFTQPNPLIQINKQVKGYKVELSKYTLISSFSYFEAFVVDIIEELIKFNGGVDEFKHRAKTATIKAIHRQENKYTREKITLFKNKSNEDSKIHIATQKLKKENFIFPSFLLSHLGIKALMQKLDNLKSVDIPNLMIDAFSMDWEEKDIKNFHKMRDTRNRIAHGNKVTLNIKEVTKMNSQIRDIALKIDQHLIEHFFLSEKYI